MRRLSLLEEAKMLARLPEAGKGDGRLPGTGALPLRRDLRLRDLSSARDVRQQLLDGVPAQYDLSQYVKGAYWQGYENSCVAYSTAGMQSIFEEIQQRKWIEFDA